MVASIRSVLWLLALVWLVGVGRARAAENFVPGVDDLPLMPGLSALTGQGVVFEAPSGRVIEAWAEGAVSRDAVLSFYGSTFPQLGWTAAAPDLFPRESGTFRLEVPPARHPPAQPAPPPHLLIPFFFSPHSHT